jgi:hypothetical protein
MMAVALSGLRERRSRLQERGRVPVDAPTQLGKLKRLMPSRKVFEFLLRCVVAYVVYLSLLLPFVRPSKESEVWGLGILFALVVGYAWTRLRREPATGQADAEKGRRSARQ